MDGRTPVRLGTLLPPGTAEQAVGANVNQKVRILPGMPKDSSGYVTFFILFKLFTIAIVPSRGLQCKLLFKKTQQDAG